MPSQNTDIIEQPPDNARSPADGEPLSFDETVRRALAFCGSLPDDFAPYKAQLAELQTRLSKGRLHFAVLGQFNRGKSTFINALLQIKALPTSVLPLTSVPTVIEYGAEQRCKIRFLDGSEDLVIKDSAEEIEDALRKYVAEENNPKNRLQVKDVYVSCASGLLENGTALIDTPGFGSTHLHNTQTTLDLLIECDAALFLLSADPPMTQTEMEFLRLVKERVPKIFFILNKVDLLTPEGLEEVDRFIRNILTGELGFPSDTTLYHTCAIKGYDKGSGLDAVKNDLLDFMVKEKYFTLSEALSDKYNEAMSGTKNLLDTKLNDKLAPIDAVRQEITAITTAIQSLSLELESQIKKSAEEKDAIDNLVKTRTKEDAEHYAQSMDTALNALLSDKYFPTEAANIASTLLPKHADDLGAQLLGGMLEQANKSIRSIVLNHTIAFAGMKKRYAEHLAGSNIKPQELNALLSRYEISMADYHKIFNSAPFPTPLPQMTDIFRKKQARFEAIREFYEPLCTKCISENIGKASKQARASIDAAWGNMQKNISAAYQEIIDHMKRLHRSKKEKFDRNQTAAKGEILFLREKLKEISSYSSSTLK
jgi:ribosome biogenesis GTPase A